MCKGHFCILKRDSKKKRAKTERKWEKLKKNYIKNTNLKPPSFMHSKSTFICSNELYLLYIMLLPVLNLFYYSDIGNNNIFSRIKTFF